jgi:hypothetical protein
MTIRNITFLSLAIAFVFASSSTAYAQSATSTMKGNSTSSAATSTKSKENGNATSTSAKAKEAATSTKGNATSTAAKEEANGAEHRSVVATFVKTLLAQADRLGGIGQQVRVIANEQASSSEKISAAIDKVSKRNGFLTFLVGSDYKTLGEIRSEIGRTEVGIVKLQTELAKVKGTSAEAAIQAEITALQAELAKVKAFVDANEDSFSLFGWMRK